MSVVSAIGDFLLSAEPFWTKRVLLRLGGRSLVVACPHLRRELSVHGPALFVSHSPKLCRVNGRMGKRLSSWIHLMSWSVCACALMMVHFTCSLSSLGHAGPPRRHASPLEMPQPLRRGVLMPASFIAACLSLVNVDRIFILIVLKISAGSALSLSIPGQPLLCMP